MLEQIVCTDFVFDDVEPGIDSAASSAIFSLIERNCASWRGWGPNVMTLLSTEHLLDHGGSILQSFRIVGIIRSKTPADVLGTLLGGSVDGPDPNLRLLRDRAPGRPKSAKRHYLLVVYLCAWSPEALPFRSGIPYEARFKFPRLV